ncbi:MAG TPA: histidine--tRNA ligase [Pyrinomonadaceae bacterium]|nr:histidine--tRNA ligase [Pyrinomonadaceae bacterium]
MSNTNPARGMRDFLPSDVRKREYVIGIIKEVYESYGFEPLETPAVENIETLMGKYGEEGNQLIFKILKRGEKLSEELQSARVSEFQSSPDSLNSPNSPNSLSDLALRYDLTVPLARVVANRKNDLPKFFKRYQIQPVWRADRPARGRFREFYQCDVDAIGSKSMTVEAELISAVTAILRRLGFTDFTIRLNHREVLRDLLDTAGIAEEKHSEALVAIDKLDKIGQEGVAAELAARGIRESSSQMILDLFARTQSMWDQEREGNRTILSNLINIVSNEVLTELGHILTYSGKAPVIIDPSLARGLSYYTGTIMEINVPDLAGSLGGGGRYDGLIGMFGKEQIPACGFSLGLERILVVMDERGMFPPEIASNASADVMVTIWNEDSIGESLKLANELRQQNLRVLLYPEPDKLGKQFKYASQLNISWVCVLGESELAENKVTLKNMQTGEQLTIKRDQLYGEIKKTSSS